MLALFSLIAPLVGSDPGVITASAIQSGSQIVGTASTNLATDVVADVIASTTSWSSATNTPIFTVEPSVGWVVSSVKTLGQADGLVVSAGGVTGQTALAAVTDSGAELTATTVLVDFTPLVSAGSNTTAVGWTNTSLNYATRTNLASYMAASAPVWSNTAVFSGSAVNSNCWLYGVRGLLSKPYTATGGSYGALVSPYHFISAQHAGGGHPTFLTTNGTLLARTNYGGLAITGTDIRVNCLTAPATDCDFVPIVGPLMTNRFGTNQNIVGGNSVPLVFNNQDQRIMLTAARADYIRLYASGQTSKSVWSNDWSQWTWDYNGGQSQVRGGDSGTPIYFCLSNQLYLVGTWYVANGFPWLGNYTNAIQAAMNSLSSASGTPTQTLQVLDVSGYPAY